MEPPLELQWVRYPLVAMHNLDSVYFIYLFIYLLFIFLKLFIYLFVVNFVIHWNETAMGLHVFPIPIPPPTTHSTRSP